MTAKVQKWGNSLAVRIPTAVARQILIEQGDAVELKVAKGALTIRATRPRYRLAELVAQMDSRNRHAEVSWGKTVGRES